MKKLVLLACVFYLCGVSAQTNKFKVFPDVGYSWQKVHVFSAGFHPAIAFYDKDNYLRNTYAVTINAELNIRNGITYLSPNIGLRGYNDLWGNHRGICYGINTSNYHTANQRDWLLTPEVGLTLCGANFMIGYSFNLDQKDLDFYYPLKFSFRVTI